MPEAVEFPKTNLNDIPAQLRAMADRIENGDESGQAVTTVFCVVPVKGAWPRVFGWGDVEGQNDPVVQFELAKLWLLTNLVERLA